MEKKNNIERLLSHLKDNSLASRLVQAYQDSDNSMDSMKAILQTRLEQVRGNIVKSKD